MPCRSGAVEGRAVVCAGETADAGFPGGAIISAWSGHQQEATAGRLPPRPERLPKPWSRSGGLPREETSSSSSRSPWGDGGTAGRRRPSFSNRRMRQEVASMAGVRGQEDLARSSSSWSWHVLALVAGLTSTTSPSPGFEGHRDGKREDVKGKPNPIAQLLEETGGGRSSRRRRRLTPSCYGCF
jgi:hypothetical protein